MEGELEPGSPIALRADQALLQDATGTMAFMQYEQLGVPRVQLERAVQYIDHNVIQLDFKNPDDHRMLQALARKHGAYYSRAGNGISHYISLERFAKSGQILRHGRLRFRCGSEAIALPWLFEGVTGSPGSSRLSSPWPQVRPPSGAPGMLAAVAAAIASASAPAASPPHRSVSLRRASSSENASSSFVDWGTCS